jgi:uncharacterized protein (TIGR02246 family)
MTEQPSDLHAAVSALVRSYHAAWNADDLDALCALFTDDVHWVNIVGMHWHGRAEVEQAHRAFFDLMFKGVSSHLEEIESVVQLSGGEAIAVVRLRMDAFLQPDGIMKPESVDRMTLVLVPTGNGLRIKHGANIWVVPEAQPFNPVPSRN